MDFSDRLLGRSRICFQKTVNLNFNFEATKDREIIFMIRLILLLILILFVAWILRPFLKTKHSNKTKDAVEKILDSDRSKFRQQNTVLIISAVILLALIVWLLPKFGINFLGLLQKIIPIMSSLRGILPF
tara:strand:- start:243 stop:632 length:390 start_codon:yes stop_codon:yes gene_type:complete